MPEVTFESFDNVDGRALTSPPLGQWGGIGMAVFEPHTPHEQEREVFMMPSETSAPRQRILVIDDEFDIREVLRDRHNAMTESASKIIRNRLQALVFDVVVAGSGHHRLALIEDHASKGCQIDGILLNWKMPGSDYSMAALQKLQEEQAEIPVIVMAALSQIERLDWFEDMMRKGARDCILKPLDNDLLLGEMFSAFHATLTTSRAGGLPLEETRSWSFVT